MLRGGALKPTTTGRWAHLVCAVSIPEVLLQDPVLKQPVIATDIPRSRKKLVCVLNHSQSVATPPSHLQKCYMCVSVQASMARGLGVCVQCVRERCYSSFHATCAQYRGLLSEEYGERCGLVCHKHYLAQVSLPALLVGSKVMCEGVCCRRSREEWR